MGDVAALFMEIQKQIDKPISREFADQTKLYIEEITAKMMVFKRLIETKRISENQ